MRRLSAFVTMISLLFLALTLNVECETVSDETKAVVIAELLRSLGSKDAAISADGNVYLYIAPSIYKKVPKKINGIKIEFLKSTLNARESRISYITFSGWGFREGRIFLRNSYYFYDGNTSGCELEMAKQGPKWVQINATNCSATAS